MIGSIFPWLYRRQSLPGPGSGNISFETLALPEFTPIGPGISNRHQYLSTPQTVVPHVIGINGIGGPLHGTAFQTALVVRSNS